MGDGYSIEHPSQDDPAELYERHREFMPRSHGGWADVGGTSALGDKACAECGATYTVARFSDTCLRCS